MTWRTTMRANLLGQTATGSSRNRRGALGIKPKKPVWYNRSAVAPWCIG